MYYIGFDIGGTKCAVSLGEWIDREIKIIKREEIPTASHPEDVFDRLSPFVQEWKTAYHVERAGISCGGPLDSKNGVIISTPNLSKEWHNFAIVDYVQVRFGLRAKLENDANASAVAEWKFGAGRGAKNVVFMTFGTGLGAGIILDGKLYSGTNGNAGEIGHIRLSPTGPLGYGKNGSFEGFCSGGGIARLAISMAKRQKKLPAYMQNASEVTTKRLAQAAFEGDAFAKKVFAKSGRMLGKGLSVLIDVLNPEKIVIGGVFMRSGELLIPSMQKEIAREALACSRSVCQIVPAKLSENVGDIAAISVAVLED